MAEKPPGAQSWWLTLPGILTAAAAVITAITGLLLGLNGAGLLGGHGSPTTATSAPPARGSSTLNTSAPFRGFILFKSIEYRPEPRLSSPVKGYLPPNTGVFIVCVATGDEVTGPGEGGGPNVSTRLWDKVRTEADGHDLGFVPDVWVKTSTVNPQADPC
jgi:hypothetical protein